MPARRKRDKALAKSTIDVTAAERDRNIKKSGQMALFSVGEDWEKDWRGMPEFVQQESLGYRTIVVHFVDQAAVDKFMELVGEFGAGVHSIWFPQIDNDPENDWRYVSAT